MKTVPISELKRPEYAILLHYPIGDPREAVQRADEIATLGVTHVVLEGPATIGNFRVLGKGCVSIVLKVLTKWGVAALKMRRANSDRPSMEREAAMHRVANSAGVGPLLFAHSKNAIVMELIDGVTLSHWLTSTFQSEGLRRIIVTSLSEARKLDAIGLDHGELSRAGKHIIVTEACEGRVIDFESASMSRRPRNVTSLASFFFMRKPVAELARRLVSRFDVEKFLSLLRGYKRTLSDNSFRELLEFLSLGL